jgi:hypothetical protein
MFIAGKAGELSSVPTISIDEPDIVRSETV